jgi:hypothetical protein
VERSSVVDACSCPMSRCTSLIGTPADTNHVAHAQVVEAQAPPAVGDRVGDGRRLRRQLVPMLEPLVVHPYGEETIAAVALVHEDLAQQSGPTRDGRQTRSRKLVRFGRCPNRFTNSSPSGPGGTSCRWRSSSSTRCPGSGMVRRPALDFGYGLWLRRPATSTTTRVTWDLSGV